MYYVQVNQQQACQLYNYAVDLDGESFDKWNTSLTGNAQFRSRQGIWTTIFEDLRQHYFSTSSHPLQPGRIAVPQNSQNPYSQFINNSANSLTLNAGILNSVIKFTQILANIAIMIRPFFPKTISVNHHINIHTQKEEDEENKDPSMSTAAKLTMLTLTLGMFWAVCNFIPAANSNYQSDVKLKNQFTQIKTKLEKVKCENSAELSRYKNSLITTCQEYISHFQDRTNRGLWFLAAGVCLCASAVFFGIGAWFDSRRTCQTGGVTLFATVACIIISTRARSSFDNNEFITNLSNAYDVRHKASQIPRQTGRQEMYTLHGWVANIVNIRQ